MKVLVSYEKGIIVNAESEEGYEKLKEYFSEHLDLIDYIYDNIDAQGLIADAIGERQRLLEGYENEFLEWVNDYFKEEEVE